MSFASSLTSVGGDLLLMPLFVCLFGIWFWPGATEVKWCGVDGTPASSLWAWTNVLSLFKCEFNPHASLSVFNTGSIVWESVKGSVTLLTCSKASVFWDSKVWLVLPSETFVSLTWFCKELDGFNVSDGLTDSQSEPLVVTSEAPVSHLRADAVSESSSFGVWLVGTLFSCGCVFTPSKGLEMILWALFFAPKKHFSLLFLHIQSCNLEYMCFLARIGRGEIPLTKDRNPFFLLRHFASLRGLRVRCIWERLVRLKDGGSHESCWYPVRSLICNTAEVLTRPWITVSLTLIQIEIHVLLIL